MFKAFFGRKIPLLIGSISVLTFLHSFTLQSPLIGVLLLVSSIYFMGAHIGPRLIQDERKAVNTIAGVLGVIVLLSIFGAIIYYTLPSTKIVFNLFFLLFSLIISVIPAKSSDEQEANILPTSKAIFGFLIVFFIALFAWWATILPIEITESIRSVWMVISPTTVLLLGLAFYSATHISTSGRIIQVPVIGALFFSAISIAATVFPLGYGFDPFIHRTTVAHILEYGTITPKPLYYIGQYALELLSAHVFTLPLHTVDIYLLPVAATVILCGSAWIGFSQLMDDAYGPSMLALFFLPLAPFISTTPQALSYVFTISLLLLSLPILAKKIRKTHISLLVIITLATIVTHPLAGIPAFIYLVLVVLFAQEKLPSTLSTPAIALTSVLGAITLPIVFALQAKFSGLDVSTNLGNLFNLEGLHFTFFFKNNFSPTFDGLYLVIDNIFWITALFAIIGIAFSIKERAPKGLYLPLIAAVMWLVNYWLLSTVLEFSFLIEYERQNYSERLYILTLIFLLPYVGIALAAIWQKLKTKNPTLKAAWLLLVTVIFVGQVYGAYPRHDGYARSAGFNVSQNDFDTVHAVNRIAGESDYIVLANQAVSAAALESFGFKTYYNGTIFYYPIPTGGELYEIYLEMTDEDPTRERAEAAMDLAGVDTAYFIVNDYWWESARIVEYAKTEADDWFSIDDGALTVFTYSRDSSE